MITRIFCIFGLLTLIWTKGYSCYQTKYLTTLIEESEIIVYGKIIGVNKETFQIVSLKTIKSKSEFDTLTILQFGNWTCAERYADYEIGQEAIFFFAKDENMNLRPIGSGNEGELIVKKDSAYISNYVQTNFLAKKVDFISDYDEFIAVDINTIIQGLEIYLANIDFIGKNIKSKNKRATKYQHSNIEKLPKNYFLSIVFDQMQRGLY